MLPTSGTGLLFEGSQASSVCTSVKSSMYMSRSMEHRWDYRNREDGYTVRKTGPNVAFPTTDLIFTVPGSNTGVRGVRSWGDISYHTVNTLRPGNNEIGSVRITWHWGAFVQLLLQLKTINITYSECVCRLRYTEWKALALFCHLWTLALLYFSTLSHKWPDFRKSPWTQNVSEVLYECRLQHFSFWEELGEISSKMCIGLHVKYRYSGPILRKLEFSWHIFQKYSSIIFYENSSSVSQVVTRGQTGMTKLTVAFRNFANAPKN
jgi:hypothetical protein